VDAGLGGGLDELATELSGQGFTLCMQGKGDSVSFDRFERRYPVFWKHGPQGDVNG
jgi:hypothetical protein